MISPVSKIKLPVPPFFVRTTVFLILGPGAVPPPLLDPTAARDRHHRRRVRRLSAPRYTYWLN